MDTILDLTQARQAAQSAPVPPPADKQLLVSREMDVPVTSYVAPDGTVHKDTLVSRILTFDGKASIARMEADLCQGRAFSSMSPEKQAWIRKVAYITFHLVSVPDWLSKWAPVDDLLLNEVWANCQAHDYLFFRSDPAQGAGTTPNQRVVVASQLVALADEYYRKDAGKQ